MAILTRCFFAALLTFTAFHLGAQDCSVPSLPPQFKARLAWRSSQDGPSIVATPMVANMNPQEDSIPEIIVGEGTTNALSPNRIQFYRGDGSNFNNPMVLTVPGRFDFYPIPGPVIGDIDRDGIPELVMTCFDGKIRVFNHYTENPAAPMTLWVTSADNTDFPDQKPFLADFNGDGAPEIYAGNDIFKFNLSNPFAPTLTKIINGPAMKGRSHYSDYNEGSCNPTAVDLLTPADCNGDPDCLGLELAAGPVIYSIDVDLNDGDGYQIKVQRDLNQMIPGAQYTDGYTAAADVNLDGVLDLIVTGENKSNIPGAYVWNKNGLIYFFRYPFDNSLNNGSLACVANVYQDTVAGFARDFPEILICSSHDFICFNLNIAQSTNGLQTYWWELPTSDDSGWTGASVYDFNADGVAEIVYRDETDFRILYGGPSPFPSGVDAERNWLKMPCFSITSDDYPVIADLDNDGETEVAVTGRLNGAGFNTRGRLHVFESAATPWVPSRNVWNQFNYFVVNVNDDLTIPAQQPLHHLEAPGPGSNYRPLNHYLAQRPVWNDSFKVLIPLPDAAAVSRTSQCLGDSVAIALEICNEGDKILPAGTPVAFYGSDPTQTSAVLLGAIQTLPAAVDVDSCRIFPFTVPKPAGTIYGVINDDGSHARPYDLSADFPVTNELECFWSNNIFHVDVPQAAQLDLGPDFGACSDTLVTLKAAAGFSEYVWQDGSHGNAVQTQLPGWYWVEVTDFCQQKHRDSVLVSRFEQPVIQIDTINGDCFGNPAVLTAAVQGNASPFEYEWSTGDHSEMSTVTQDGLYSVTVTNAKGCTATATAWADAGGTLQANLSVITPILCPGQTGVLQVDLTTGKAPFTYEWSDGSSGNLLSGAGAGLHAVTVTDADQCRQVLQQTLPPPDTLQSTGISVLAACPGEANGQTSFLGATHGLPPYTLAWSTGSSDPNLSNLVSGAYQLTISDANGCSIQEAAQVPEFIPPVLQSQVLDAVCFGRSDGEIHLSPTGGSPVLSYSWSNQAAGPAIDHLPAGQYALTVTFGNGNCVQLFDFHVNEPPPVLLSGASVRATCKGGGGGSIDLSVVNGVAPFQYRWSSGAQTEDLADVAAGMYQVTVTDAAGCTEIYSQEVGEWPAVSLVAQPELPRCNGGSDGSIQLTTGGGVAPFQYQWSTGATGSALTGITAGQYLVTVTDAEDCEETLAIPLGQPLPMLGLGISAQPVCPGQSNGEAQFLGATQGVEPYSLQWSNGATASQLSQLAAGIYSLTVSDAHGCTLVDMVEIGAFDLPQLSASVTEVRCAGENNGVIHAAITGGSPGFDYQWSNGSDQAQINQLVAGAYALTLTYAGGKCSEIYHFEVPEPPLLAITDAALQMPDCNGAATGAIQVSAAGGTTPYQFSWTGGGQGGNLSDLMAGVYDLTLTDGHQCSQTGSFTLIEPAPLALQAGIQADTCETAGGSITIQTTGGTAPYQAIWADAHTSFTHTALAAGAYALTVTDARQCTGVGVFEVPEYGKIPHLTLVSEKITCAHPLANLQLTADQTGLHYQWQGPGGALPDQAVHSVATGGQYQVTVTNAFGCQAAAAVQTPEDKATPVAEAGPPVLQALCDETERLLSGAGSSTGLLFDHFWSDAPLSQSTWDTTAVDILIHKAGTYYHTVINHDNGCVAVDSILVRWDAPIHAEFSAEPVLCFGAHNGVIRIEQATGGTAPYYYSIDNQHFKTSGYFANLGPGTYALVVRDDYGCSWEATTSVAEPPLLSVELTASDTAVILGRSVTLTAIPDPAGVVLREIDWSPKEPQFLPFSLTQEARPEVTTTYMIRIADENGCVATDRLHLPVYNQNIYVPNVIYPGTENNGGFTAFGGNGAWEIRLLRIYDRWGDLMFERRGFPLNDPAEGWDGSFRGQPVNPGVFAWYMEVLMQDGRVLFLKGDVTVVR